MFSLLFANGTGFVFYIILQNDAMMFAMYREPTTAFDIMQNEQCRKPKSDVPNMVTVVV